MQQNYFDPFSIWKSMYNEMEPKMSQAMQKWLESEEYAAFSGQMLAATLQMEQQVLKTVEQILRSYNIPTMKDIARLGDLLVGLENKVDNIDEQLVELRNLVTQSADVREQLDAIVAQLDVIGKNRRRTKSTDDGEGATE